MKEERERTPLRVVLQNFINHVENLEAYEDSYDKEFQDLKLFSETLKTSGEYSCKEGEKEYNRKKNRYKDILPFDYSRVTLSEYVGVPGSDYINANYIKGASGSPAYIASQGPLPHTVNDFWRMVVECEVQVIVMACNEEESGKHKCENYWVEKEGEERNFGMVAIKLLKASTICHDFLVRTMKLRYVNSRSFPEERLVCQFHYGAWPDHGVPGLVRPLLEMVRLVRDTQASETLPVLVHCSAGCGRTGTICAIDFVWGLLRAGKLRLDFSLFKLVRDMRKQRIAMVQTKDQYILVHQAVRELFQDQLRMIQSHPYENIDVRGLPILPASSPKSNILQPRKSVSSEEKQDGREKEIGSVLSVVSSEQASVSVADSGEAPPLPRKRRIHTLSSKQEKEVENLTQKQLSIASASGNSKVHSSCVVESLVEADDSGFTASDKNLRRVITEASAKGLDRTPEVIKLSKNPSAPDFSCLGTSLKVTVDSSSIADVQYSMVPSQAEAASNVQKPCIAKLKALFESNSHTKDLPIPIRPVDGKPRLPQLVTRSHSLGAVRKPCIFSQFNAASPEINIHSQHSSDSSEGVRCRTAKSIHSDACGPKVKEMSEIAYNLKLKTNVSSKPSMTNSDMVHSKSEPSSVAKPLKLSHNPHFSGGKLALSNSFSGILYSQEKSSDTDISFLPSSCFTPGDSRPALPVKRSKSLKVQSAADHFKLSVAKRNHGTSQDLSSSEDSALFSVSNSYESSAETCPFSSKECESFCHSCDSSLSSVSNPRKMCSCQSSPALLKNSSISTAEIKITDLKKSSSKPDFQNLKSEDNLDHGNCGVHLAGPYRMSIESEASSKFTERKKIGEPVPKLSRDICRAQSLHFKREKSSPHISLSHPQERVSLNGSKVEPVVNTRHPSRISNISPSHPQENIYSNTKKTDSVISSRHPSNSTNIVKLPEDSCRNIFPSQLSNKIPVEASNIIEDCRSYLLSEGVPTLDDSQQIAAASARHKVDTVAGGLGVRERRNSFRCAVGQSVDEKSTRVNSADKEVKWIKQTESHQGLRGEDISVKRLPESKSTNPPVRFEPMKIQSKSVERCKGFETNVIPKNPPLVQKSSIPNDCKYLGNIKVSERVREVNGVEKVGARAMEPRTVAGDIAQKNVGVNGRKSSDSSVYLISSPPKWKQSVVTGVKKTSYIPPKPNFGNSPMNEMMLSPPQSGVDYGWSCHQSSVHPQKMGPSLTAHSVETMGAHSNKSSAVPLEVDVDQVAASMKNGIPGKGEGTKSPTPPDNSNLGNSSTHFTRALEAIHQTAANLLRTKFSRPTAAPSSVSSRNSEPKIQVGQTSLSQLPLARPQQNGSPQREARNPDAGDVRMVVRKQQHYL